MGRKCEALEGIRWIAIAAAVVAFVVAAVGCGRVGFGSGAPTDGGDTGVRDSAADTAIPDASRDTGDQGDARVPDAAGDAGPPLDMILAPGWEFEVAVELSGEFTYVLEDFLDGVWLSNVPTDFITIGPPWANGLAVLVGRDLLAYEHTSGTVTHHDLTPAAPNDTGPDQPSDLAYAPPGVDGMAAPGIWLGSGSLGAGDGLFRFDSDWNLTNVATPGNVSFIAPDLDAVVPDRDAAVTYFGLVSFTASAGGISSLGGTKFIDGNIEDGTILADGRMLVVEGDITVTPMLTRIGIVDGGTLTEVEGYIPGIQRLLRGDVGAYGFIGMAVHSSGSLYGIDATGSAPPIAQEPTTNWLWTSAQVVSAGILGLPTQSILVMRTRLDTSELQVIRFWRP